MTEQIIDYDGSFKECDKACPECGQIAVYYKQVDRHIGAYCLFCDKWITWVPQWNDNNWARYIKERDGYICRICGKQLYGKEAHAHHLIPWWLNEKFRYDKNNGCCLCNACHKKIHGKAGTIKESEE